MDEYRESSIENRDTCPLWRASLRITHKMFFQFFTQEINIVKDIFVKPALSEKKPALSVVEGSNGMASGPARQLIRFWES